MIFTSIDIIGRMREVCGVAFPKPVVKWAGGKSALVAVFRQRGLIPNKVKHYYEPFLGGASLFFTISSCKRIEEATLSDINRDLINLYQVIRDKPDLLINELEQLQEHTHRDEYYKNRDEFNALKVKNGEADSIRKASLFIYLNKTCYNGLYRVNKKGAFNVPFCGMARKSIFKSDNIYSVSRALKGVNLLCADYKDVCEKAQEGDFIFLDPPYMPFSDTLGFTDYSEDGFDEQAQEHLCSVYKDLTERGAKVLLSNSYHREVRRMYRGLPKTRLSIVEVQRYMSCKGDGRGLVKEYAITNFKTSKSNIEYPI